ncbi:MAG: carboxypeptidase-like regulatory domain-containing protein, partial [Planctomycetota bacterium]
MADDQGRFEIVLEVRELHVVWAKDLNSLHTPALARGVEPGTLDLDLQLTPARWIAIRAWERDGAALVEDLKVRIESDLPGSYDVSGAQVSPGGGGLRLRVPVEPFRVVVTVPGYAEGVQGPFDPESPPAELDFSLEALAGIGGRVVYGGEPVAGARVELRWYAGPGSEISSMGFRMRMLAHARMATTTDDEGRFRLAADRSDEYVLLVNAESFARAEWGQVQIDPHIPVEGVEIEIVRGGSIEGRVIPPAGREAVGLLVSVSRGDCDVRFERTDEGGHFRFDDLTPGGWNVAYRVREAQWSAHYGPGSDAWEPRWDCLVLDGSATRYDIDLRFESLAAVSGRLVLDGQPAAGWTAQAVSRYAADLTDPVRPVALAVDGRFELRVSRGAYELSLQSPAGDHGQVRLVRQVEIGEDGLEWDLASETGGLAGMSALGARSVRYSGDLPNGVTCSATLQPADDGLFSLTGIPVGHGRLHRMQWKQSVGADIWTLLRELDIEPGTVLELELD